MSDKSTPEIRQNHSTNYATLEEVLVRLARVEATLALLASIEVHHSRLVAAALESLADYANTIASDHAEMGLR